MDPKNALVGDLIDETSLPAGGPTSPMLDGALALDVDATTTDDKSVTREQRRSRRKRDVRGESSVSMNPVSPS